jgi:UrcA family protein
MNIRASVISSAALLGLALSVPVVAATAMAAEPPSVTVLYDHSHLVNKKDAEHLYLRLQSATRRVCAVDSVTQRNRVALPCYREVLAKAVRDVNEPEVTALYLRTLQSGQSSGQVALGGSVSTSASK